MDKYIIRKRKTDSNTETNSMVENSSASKKSRIKVEEDLTDNSLCSPTAGTSTSNGNRGISNTDDIIVNSYDIGNYIDNIGSIPDSLKYELLKNHFKPAKNYVFPYF